MKTTRLGSGMLRQKQLRQRHGAPFDAPIGLGKMEFSVAQSPADAIHEQTLGTIDQDRAATDPN